MFFLEFFKIPGKGLYKIPRTLSGPGLNNLGDLYSLVLL